MLLYRLTQASSNESQSLLFGAGLDVETQFLDFYNLNTSNPGISVEVTRLICSILKYTCSITFELDPNWFSWGGDGKLIAGVSNGTMDGTLPLWFYSRARGENLSFSTISIPVPYYFATRKYQSEPAIGFSSLVGSFTWRTWLLLILTMLLLSAAINVSQFSPCKFKWINFYKIFMSTWIYLVRKAFPIENTTRSSKVSLLIWGISAILLTSAYSGGLMSSMFKINSKPPFTDFESLLVCLTERRCKMIFQKESPWFSTLMDDNTFQYHKIRDALWNNKPIIVKNYLEAIETIEKTSDVFLVSEMILLTDLTSRNITKCSLYLVELRGYYHFIFQKNHKLLSDFNVASNYVESSGIIKHLINKYLRHNNPCSSYEKSTFGPVPSRFGLAALIVLIAGLVVAFFVLLCEIFLFCRAK